VSGERLAQETLVLGEHAAIAFSQLPEQARRALDVREEKGNGAPRPLGHSS